MQIPYKLAGIAAGIAILLAACAPATKVPGATPVFYSGSKSDVFAAVVQAISTSPGLDNSNGWVITQSDSSGGFVHAETTVTGYNLFVGVTRVTEQLSVVVSSGESATHTQVVIQASSGARALAQRVRNALSAKFGGPSST